MVSFYASAATLLISAVFGGIFAYGHAGAGGAMIAAGVMLIVSAVLAAAAAVIQKYSFKAINMLVKGFAKSAKKILGR